jgi:hypothetical protein
MTEVPVRSTVVGGRGWWGWARTQPKGYRKNACTFLFRLCIIVEKRGSPFDFCSVYIAELKITGRRYAVQWSMKTNIHYYLWFFSAHMWSRAVQVFSPRNGKKNMALCRLLMKEIDF